MIKPYKELNSLEKVARGYDQRRSCKRCDYVSSCTVHLCDVCTMAFEKGFITGVKHHRKIVKNRNNGNPIQKKCSR